MARSRSQIARRDFIVAGTVGGAALVVAPTWLVGRGSSAPTAALGRVAEGGLSNQPVHLQVGDQLLTVDAAGFPEGWELLVGDKLVVDLENLKVCPHLRFLEPAGRNSRVFLAVNENPRFERVFESPAA